MKDRDCENCTHYVSRDGVKSCDRWDCEPEPKNDLNYIHHQTYMLRSMADFEDLKHGRGCYKWELGVNVYAALEREMFELVGYYNGNEVRHAPELMGIPIGEPNKDDPDVIKLWREVK